MRVWRRIANDPKYTRTKWSDLQIRIALGIPSLDVCLRKRRLKYLARLAECGVEPLLASLQAVSHKGEKMPWVLLIESDIKVFLAHPSVGSKLYEVQQGVNSVEECWKLAKSYPKAWSGLVDLYFSCEDDACERYRSQKRPQSNIHALCATELLPMHASSLAISGLNTKLKAR